MYAEGIWEGDILVADSVEVEKFRRVRNPCSETQREGSDDAEKWWKFHIPDRRRDSYVVGNRS